MAQPRARSGRNSIRSEPLASFCRATISPVLPSDRPAGRVMAAEYQPNSLKMAGCQESLDLQSARLNDDVDQRRFVSRQDVEYELAGRLAMPVYPGHLLANGDGTPVRSELNVEIVVRMRAGRLLAGHGIGDAPAQAKE